MCAVDDVVLLPLEGDGVDLQHPDDLVHDALCLHSGGGLHAPCEAEGTRLGLRTSAGKLRGKKRMVMVEQLLIKNKNRRNNKHKIQPIVFLINPYKTFLGNQDCLAQYEYLPAKKDFCTIIVDSVLDYLLDLIYGTSTCKLHHYS